MAVMVSVAMIVVVVGTSFTCSYTQFLSAWTGRGVKQTVDWYDKGREGAKNLQNCADILWMTPKSLGQVLFTLSMENSMPFCYYTLTPKYHDTGGLLLLTATVFVHGDT